jgi:7,8-dihydropterin-6-yl-methyl-4-(beta-D-ribofuranosyl)aminobenzene 5'-phosphate synthase
MKISILTENTAGKKFLAEHGLSYFIEYENQKFLFDTGHSDVFLKNAIQLGINIQAEVKTIILSHGHWDHGDGLKYLKNKTLLTHPSAFMKRYHRKESVNLGLALTREKIEEKFDLITSKEPYSLTQGVIYLGEIPRLNDFESKTTPFMDASGSDDFVPDDSALAVIKDNGLIVITGCSHAGICNIIEYAKKVSGIRSVNAVIGGFHLKYNDMQTLKTINYLKKEKIGEIYPSHCTELPALAMFYSEFENVQVKTGMVINF